MHPQPRGGGNSVPANRFQDLLKQRGLDHSKQPVVEIFGRFLQELSLGPLLNRRANTGHTFYLSHSQFNRLRQMLDTNFMAASNNGCVLDNVLKLANISIPNSRPKLAQGLG